MKKEWRLALACVAFALVSFGGAATAAAQQEPTATLTVHYRVCAEIPADGDYFTACHDTPSDGGYIEIYNADTSEVVASGNADEAGNITFQLFAGTYGVGGPPGDFLDAVEVFCSRDDAPAEGIGYPVQLGTGGAVTCDFYIVPSCNDVDGDCDNEPAPPAPGTATQTPPASQPVTVALPNTGAGMLSDTSGLGWSLPLAGAALALLAVAALQGQRRRA